MPMHDWTTVDAGIFHAFHHEWISELSRALNRGVLPSDYYALPEQIVTGFGPDVLTLQNKSLDNSQEPNGAGLATKHAIRTRPKTRFTAESAAEFYRKKKKGVSIRHVSDDELIAMIEIVSPGNKSGRKVFQLFLDKVYELLAQGINLLILDPLPPGNRDPNGIHAAIWEEVESESFALPKDKPLTLVAYECDLTTRALIETIAVGDPLPDMPLFLEPNGCVMVPLETTYMAAFAAMPRRWRDQIH